MIKKTFIISLMLLICFSTAGIFANGSQENAEGYTEPTIFNLSHSYETSTPFHTNAVWAADEIKKRTDGRYEIEVFPSGTLGTEREIEEALALGTVDMGFVGPGHMAQTYAPISIHLAAFLWRDIDHFKLYPTSDVYKKVTSEYMKKSSNHILSLTYFGQRHVSSNVALHTPEDFKGLKMRVPPIPIYMIFPEAVEANSTPINFSELYMALQQGVVDAQENPLPTIKAKKFYEVQKYIVLTGHMTDGFYTLAGDHVWAKLSEEDRAVFETVFTEAAERTTNDIVESENNMVQWFRDQGIEVIEVDRKPFMEAVSGSMSGGDLPWTSEMITELKELGL